MFRDRFVRFVLVLAFAVGLSGCSLRLPVTPHNPIVWSEGVAHLYCVSQGRTIYDVDVLRIVVLNHTIRIDTETGLVVKLQGRCTVTRH